MQDKDKVGVAIIGCGAISGIFFRNLTKEFGIIKVIACCDLNTELAESVAKEHSLEAKTIDEIIADERIEIVVNLTPPEAHYDIIMKLLENGKHVYTEKVLVPEFEKAIEVVDFAEAKKLMLCSAPDTFIGAAVQTVRGLIDSGMIGTVTSCVSVLQRDARLLAEKFPYTSRVGGGIGIDVGIYYTTAMINVLGGVEEVCGMSGIIEPNQTHYFVKNKNFGEKYVQESETYLMGTLKFDSGCIGTVHFNSRSIRTEKPYVAFYGTEGILFLEDPNFFGGSVKMILKGQTEPIEVPLTHGYDGDNRGLGVAEMAWSMKAGRVPRTNGKMALHALEILTGIVKSDETKSFYKLQTKFSKTPMIPKGYLGSSYAANDPEAGISI